MAIWLRVCFCLIAFLVMGGAASAQSWLGLESPSAGPPDLRPRDMWMSGNPADLAPLINTTWSFSLDIDGAVQTGVISFTDKIVTNRSTGVVALTATYAGCHPPLGLTEFCAQTFFVQFTDVQRDYGDLNEYGYSLLILDPVHYTWLWFNTVDLPEGEGTGPGLAWGYGHFDPSSVYRDAYRLEGRRLDVTTPDVEP